MNKNKDKRFQFDNGSMDETTFDMRFIGSNNPDKSIDPLSEEKPSFLPKLDNSHRFVNSQVTGREINSTKRSSVSYLK